MLGFTIYDCPILISAFNSNHFCSEGKKKTEQKKPKKAMTNIEQIRNSRMNKQTSIANINI